jgi:hypothetical protein
MSLSRRQFLAVSGIACSLSIAGCSGPNAGDGIDYGNASVNSETTTPSAKTESNSTEINEEDNSTTTNSSKDGDERDTDVSDEGTASNVGPKEAMRRHLRALRNNDLETLDRYTFEDVPEQGDQVPEWVADANPPELVVIEEYTAEEVKQQVDSDAFDVTEYESLVKERESIDDYTLIYMEFTDPDFPLHEDYYTMIRRDGIWVLSP